ncbi:auxilin-related protein 2 [Carica papaya]|uniref:auxilin-related protein 2 n=1 Tax=Carica papaya TaxID=3649 RepID=UPI000B8C95C8|nr:auxilin-related protein 2 [Carica papaya]XP_021907526.1 auxilin-related protein 2 [Carica papaya]XP_021907527.1 auxilin-related protein 2 [Carica papaya]XP_021907528.1 auxilin-related protein 2 [Carica papaya]
MDDFPGILARDFGFKPQGKSAPMAPPRNSPSGGLGNYSSTPNFGLGSSAPDFTLSSSASNRSKSNSNPIFDDQDGGGDGLLFNDVFGGPPKYGSASDSRTTQSSTAFDYDSIFKDRGAPAASKSSSMPVYDKPVYDEDIFEGLPGVKSSSASATSVKYEDVFSSISSPPTSRPRKQENSAFDDLLGGFGKKETELRKTEKKETSTAFDDLIPGFGGGSSATGYRSTSEPSWSQEPSSDSSKTDPKMMEDPFVVLESTTSTTAPSSGLFTDPLEHINKFSSSGSSKADRSSPHVGVFDDLDPLENFGKSKPEISKRGQDKNHLRTESVSGTQSPVENFESHSQKKVPVNAFQDSYQMPFDVSSVSGGQAASPYMNGGPNETNSQVNTTPRSDEYFESSDDVWLTVSEVPLFTQPTSAPPPSRPPPPRPTRSSKSDAGSVTSTNTRKKINEYSSFQNSTQYPYSPNSVRASTRDPVASQIDELEDFGMGRTQNNINEYADAFSGEDMGTNSMAAASAAAMKEAMDKAEAKFRHAREMREREYLKTTRSKEGVQLDKDDSQERELREKQERLDHERQQREREEEEREQQRRLEKEREREEREREQRRLEKERMDRERELARQAVERATREARERAAAEARERAAAEARKRAEKAAVEKVAAEARERAEKFAVQRAQAEARERAAAEAKERAERAAAEARERAERAAAEAREREARERNEARVKTERAAVERAAAEARERAAAEARERAAAAARANQQKNENDLESFFSMGSRPSSAPRPRANSSDPVFDTQSKGGPEAARRTSVGTSTSMRKASSTANIVDDLSSIFGAAPSPAREFQEVEGETEERRRARLERHQRTQERAAKALAEKNQRDLQAQREQAERHRIGETLDIEIKRWAAGKEGNLRALLSTLQYVLWPECGWQPVSLTDLITAASVKKVYRKANLCIHPDKVQQKGANLQQKYIAEKVFDLLKEAWNKFNSEELF